MKYCWNGVGFDADANKVGEELKTIEKREELTREKVVEYAKNKESELHKCFEWDDKIAGEKFRLVQATNVLTSISIVYEEESQKTTRLFVNIKNEDKKREYKNIVSVLENDEEYLQILNKAERDFLSYKEKYNGLIELKDLKQIIYKNI